MKKLIYMALAAAIATSLPLAATAQKNCPPGLARQSTRCVPPGLAKQGMTAEEWLNRHYVGEELDEDEYVPLERTQSGGAYSDLPRLPRSEIYAEVDGAIVRVERDTSRVLEFVRMAEVLSQ